MFEMFSNLCNATRKYFDASEWVSFACFCIALVTVIFGAFVSAWPFYTNHTWIFYGVPYFFLVLTLFRPVTRMAQTKGTAAAHYLAAWSLLGMLGFIVTLYAVVTDISAAAVTAQQKYLVEKLQALPVVIIPVWVAAIGWFLQVQAARKTQRTQHAFAFVMQTRTSVEFNARMRKLQLVYPAGISVQELDRTLFDSTAVMTLPAKEAALATETDQQKKALLEHEIRKIEAIDALKYILNLHEFMAQGVAAGDLDDDLLYETISYAIISIYNRSKAFRDYLRGDDQVLAFEHLSKLVHRWQRRINEDEKNAKDKDGDD